MDTQRIVERLANEEYTYDPFDNKEFTKEELINELWQDVAPLCQTEVEGSEDYTSLWEWLDERIYTVGETAESIAAEYDGLK